jgi:hypothetical protein
MTDSVVIYDEDALLYLVLSKAEKRVTYVKLAGTNECIRL